MTGYLTEYGPKLIANGYSIIPIKRGFKFPKGLKNWGTIQADARCINKWVNNGFADGGVGVLTRNTPGVDIDVHDAEIVAQILSWCEKQLGATVQRVGQEPKTLLVYRAEHPFKKISSNTYDDIFGKTHKIEILGDGQQFVAYAEHPDTGKPYFYPTGKNLIDTNRSDLPIITQKHALDLIDYFESIIPDDWVGVNKRQCSSQENDFSSDEIEFRNNKPRLGLTIKDMGGVLKAINPDKYGYDRWVKTGMAIYHETSGSVVGLKLFDSWSQQGNKYKHGETLIKWRTFAENLNKVEPITFASVMHWVKKNNTDNDGVKQLEKFLARYIYVECGDLVCDLDKPTHVSLLKLSEFKNSTANIRQAIPTPVKKDPERKKWVPIHHSWLTHPKRQTAVGSQYVPEAGRLIKDDHALMWVNSFEMPVFQQTEATDKLSVFFEHMDYLVINKNEREWLVRWMAYNLQYPSRRCRVTPLHVATAHGTGRGWLVKLMGLLLGPWNCKKTKMATLSGDNSAGAYHDYLDQSLLCAIEEVRENNHRYEISDRVRDTLTEDYFEVNVKYGYKKTQLVYTNFFMMSNHVDALVLTAEDRRINVISGPDYYQNNKYYTRLYKWLETEGVTQLYNYLMCMDLSSFNPLRSMNTLAKKAMIESNQSETERLFLALKSDPPAKIMLFSDIKKCMAELSEKPPFEVDIKEGQLQKLLSQYCTKMPQIKLQKAATRSWAWGLNQNFSSEEIRKHLKS